MFEHFVKKYGDMWERFVSERGFRLLAKEIGKAGAPAKADWKALTMLLPAAAVACATAGQEARKQEISVDEALAQKQKTWAKAVPYPDSGFGETYTGCGLLRLSPHKGVDWFLDTGTPIVSAANGRITFNGYLGGGGNGIKIRHSTVGHTGYAHLDNSIAVQGSLAFRGMIIGYSGHTGSLAGKYPHLHFELLAPEPVDPYKGFWAGSKAKTYDGVSDYDLQAKLSGKVLLSAPFAGPVPTGNINLEKIISAADTAETSTKKFVSEPELYKKELFTAALALISKKQKKIAVDLAELPILNDGITKEEALSVWKLYELIKDLSFPSDFGTKKEVRDHSSKAEIYVLWSSQKEEKNDVKIRFLEQQKHGTKLNFAPYQTEKDDKPYTPQGYDYGIQSNTAPGDRDGVQIVFRGNPESSFAININNQYHTIKIPDLKTQPLQITKNLEAGLLTETQKPEINAIIATLEETIIKSEQHKTEVIESAKQYSQKAPFQWNFWLQELVRHGKENEFQGLLKNYSGLNNLIIQVWK